jgi:protein tyrosine/serine phosphatase
MAQHALGVSRDAIMEDYLLTNTAGNIEARIAAGAVQIREKHGAISDDTIRALMGVDADYLNAALQAAESAHGSLDRYLEEILDFDAERRDKLRAHYLEG